MNNALRRFQLEYVDLCFCHRPDPNTPIEETVRAMDILVRQGKIFYWGTSEWSAADIMRADGIARQYNLTPPSMEQPQYNMLWRERFEKEYEPLFRDLGYGTTIWSPLASGVLTGKYNDGIPEGTRASLEGYGWLKEQIMRPERLAKVRELKAVADELGCSQAQLALGLVPDEPGRQHGDHGCEPARAGAREHEGVGRRPAADRRRDGPDRGDPREQAEARVSEIAGAGSARPCCLYQRALEAVTHCPRVRSPG